MPGPVLGAGERQSIQPQWLLLSWVSLIVGTKKIATRQLQGPLFSAVARLWRHWSTLLGHLTWVWEQRLRK